LRRFISFPTLSWYSEGALGVLEGVGGAERFDTLFEGLIAADPSDAPSAP